MNIIILGAAGQIPAYLESLLLQKTDANLILYARNASKRLSIRDGKRERLIDGDFTNTSSLAKAMQDVDVVYVNDMGDKKATHSIVEAMRKAGINRIIAASVLGIYDEVPGAFGKWNTRMVGDGVERQKESARILEQSTLDYTLLRLTWLYDEDDNSKYTLTDKGEPFHGAQVTRQAVAQLILDIITDTSDRFIRASVGVSEPNTDWDKPSFY